MNTYREALQHAFDQRMRLNPRYSLRAFARDLELSPGFVSQVLSGKRGLNLKSAAEVFKKLGVSATQQRLYSLEIQKHQKRSESKKLLVQKQIETTLQQAQARLIQQEEFKQISHWSAIAMLQLLRLKDSPRKNKTEWCNWAAKKLNIQTALVKSTLDTLIEMKLVSEDRRAGLVVIHDDVWVDLDAPNEAVRSFHQEMIKKAMIAVELQSKDERFLQSIQFAVSQRDLPKIQNEILRFANQILRKYGKDKTLDGDLVYVLNLQLFNLLEK